MYVCIISAVHHGVKGGYLKPDGQQKKTLTEFCSLHSWVVDTAE